MISTNPPGATVTLDGQRLGRSPQEVFVAYGAHTIQVQKNGFREEQKNITVSAEELSVPFELTPEIINGTVQIMGPPGSMIQVNNQNVGTSPAVTTLIPGRYSIRVMQPDGTSFSRLVDVQFESPDTTFRIDMTASSP